MKLTLTVLMTLGLASCANQYPDQEEQQTRVPSQTAPKPSSTPKTSVESKELPATAANPAPSPTVKPGGIAPTTVQGKCVKKTFNIDLKIEPGQDHMAALKKEMTCSDKGEYSRPEVENLDLTNDEKTRCISPKSVPFTASTDPTIGFGDLRLKNSMTVEVDCKEVFQRVQHNYPGHYWYEGDIKTWGTFYCCKP